MLLSTRCLQRNAMRSSKTGQKTQAKSYCTVFSKSYETIKVEEKAEYKNVAWLTMNRPDVHNAFNQTLISEIKSVFDDIDTTKLRAVVITGEGKSFSAGADLNYMKSMATFKVKENQQDAGGLFDMFNSIRTCPLPVIARVNGAALGGGGGIVASADIAIAVEKAKFGFTEVKLGLLPATISPFVMQKIGNTHASRYFLTGERFDAKTAEDIGLLTKTSSDEDKLDEHVGEMLTHILENGPLAVQATKKLIATVDAQEDISADLTKFLVSNEIAKLRVSPEGQEGLSAFFEKRKPSWTNNE